MAMPQLVYNPDEPRAIRDKILARQQKLLEGRGEIMEGVALSAGDECSSYWLRP